MKYEVQPKEVETNKLSGGSGASVKLLLRQDEDVVRKTHGEEAVLSIDLCVQDR